MDELESLSRRMADVARALQVEQGSIATMDMAVSLAIAGSLAVTGVLTGWGLLFAAVAALVIWPQAAEIVVARRTPAVVDADAATSLEWAGIDRPLTPAQVREIDAVLGLEEVPA